MLFNPIKNAFMNVKDKADAWDKTDKSATTALYDVLDGSYGIIRPISLQEVKEQKESIKHIEQIAKEQGIILKPRVNISRKVAKLIFNDRSDNRISTMGRVLENAIAEGVSVEEFLSWLESRGGVEGAKKSLPKGTDEQVDYLQKGEENLSRAQSIFHIDKLDKTPATPKQVLLLADVQQNGTSKVMAFLEDENLVCNAISLIGQGKADLSYALDGIALEQVIKHLKDKVFSSFIMQPNYIGLTKGATSSKFEPNTLAECVLPTEDAELQIQVWLKKSPERPLFIYGPHGTGKSTVARVLASELYPNNEFKITEVNVNQTITKFTEEFKKLTVNSPFFNSSQPQILIINEAQALKPNKKDLSVLRPFLENLPDNVHVILTSNVPVIDTGINSRCLNANLSRYDEVKWQPRLKYILEQEGLECHDSAALLKLTGLLGGDIRVLLSVIDELVTRYNLIHSQPYATLPETALLPYAKSV